MLGVGPDYPIVRNWPLAAGEFFTDGDIAGATKVCVLGHTLVAQLFPDIDPIGQQVRVKNIPFTRHRRAGSQGGEPRRPGPGQHHA